MSISSFQKLKSDCVDPFFLNSDVFLVMGTMDFLKADLGIEEINKERRAVGLERVRHKGVETGNRVCGY